MAAWPRVPDWFAGTIRFAFSTGCRGGVRSGRDNGPPAIIEDRRRGIPGKNWPGGRGCCKRKPMERGYLSEEWPKLLLLPRQHRRPMCQELTPNPRVAPESESRIAPNPNRPRIPNPLENYSTKSPQAFTGCSIVTVLPNILARSPRSYTSKAP